VISVLELSGKPLAGHNGLNWQLRLESARLTDLDFLALPLSAELKLDAKRAKLLRRAQDIAYGLKFSPRRGLCFFSPALQRRACYLAYKLAVGRPASEGGRAESGEFVFHLPVWYN